MLGYGKSKFVEPFLRPVQGRMATAEEIMANNSMPMAVSGITKRIVPSQATKKGLDWWYIDSGYFGNYSNRKTWFRITRNATQNTGPVQDRPDDRLRRINPDIERYARGSRIVLVPPDAKVCETFGLSPPDRWIAEVTQQIRAHTDRPVVIRSRPASRVVRSTSDRFVDFIRQDTHAVVTWTSNCAVEAAMHGIPVVCLGPSAALPMSGDMDHIHNLPDLDPQQIDRWLRHLSYCQFTLSEMRFGIAWRILNG